MKKPPLFATALALVFAFSPGLQAEKKKGKEVNIQNAAAKIDDLVEKGLKKEEMKPNGGINDDVFLRRAYLDIVGRVPTIEEAENFHGSTYPRKRSQLISDLLESDGHVSHAFNFWADVLRINSALGNGARQAEDAYQLWLKEGLKNNKPYDQMVYEMVSATGKVWDNGAIGYYIRDRGMPLDNMSNTVRIFLGTRLECAQCHNHPFDKWTQMDYYHMAAFSYGMSARQYDSDNRRALTAMQREERREMHQNAVKVEKFPQITRLSQVESYKKNEKNWERMLERYGMNEKQFMAAANRSIKAYESYNHESRQVRNAVNDLYNPLRYVEASETERTLKLPHDYQYDDAKPHDPVKPATMFGADIDLENIDDSTIKAYADWMTSKENPTFTKVIANRLWKRVFGHGVFEPVDELTETTPVANPELLAELERLMRDLDYDMRKYMEILYNTNTYQRATYTGEMVLGTPYHFPGPVLRRMSAEQIWDSIVALALPEADGYRPRLKSQLSSVEKVRRIYDALENRSEEEYLAMVKKIAKAYADIKPKEEAVLKKMYAARDAENQELYTKLRGELNKFRQEARKVVTEIGYKNVGEKVEEGELLLAMGMSEMAMSADGEMMNGAGEQAVLTKLPKPKFPEPPAGLDKKQKSAWKRQKQNDYRVYTSLVANMARASELESPARRGHFLREFGQSDREVIENAANHASVPQALNLLNGPIVEALTNEFATFGSRIHTAGDPEEKTRMIFQAMLTRQPTEEELKIALGEIEENGDDGYESIVWALLNTQQFIFVQ